MFSLRSLGLFRPVMILGTLAFFSISQAKAQDPDPDQSASQILTTVEDLVYESLQVQEYYDSQFRSKTQALETSTDASQSPDLKTQVRNAKEKLDLANTQMGGLRSIRKPLRQLVKVLKATGTSPSGSANLSDQIKMIGVSLSDGRYEIQQANEYYASQASQLNKQISELEANGDADNSAELEILKSEQKLTDKQIKATNKLSKLYKTWLKTLRALEDSQDPKAVFDLIKVLSTELTLRTNELTQLRLQQIQQSSEVMRLKAAQQAAELAAKETDQTETPQSAQAPESQIENQPAAVLSFDEASLARFDQALVVIQNEIQTIEAAIAAEPSYKALHSEFNLTLNRMSAAEKRFETAASSNKNRMKSRFEEAQRKFDEFRARTALSHPQLADQHKALLQLQPIKAAINALKEDPNPKVIADLVALMSQRLEQETQNALEVVQGFEAQLSTSKASVQKLAKTEETLSVKERENTNLKKQVAALRDQINALGVNAQSGQQEKQKLEQKIRELNQAINNNQLKARQVLTGVQREGQKTKQRVQELEQALQASEKSLADAKANSATQDQLAQLTSQRDAALKALEDHKKQSNAERSALQTKHAQDTQALNETHASEVRNLESQIAERDKVQQALERQTEGLEKKLLRLDEEMRKSEAALEQERNLRIADRQRLSQAASQAETRTSNQADQNQELESRLRFLSDDLKSTQDAFRRVRTQNRELEAKNAELQDKLNGLQSSSSDQIAELEAQWSDQVGELEAQLKQSEAQRKALAARIDALQNDLEDEIAAKDSLQTNLARLDQRMQQLDGQRESLAAENSQLSQALSEATELTEREVRALQAENAELLRQLEALQAEQRLQQKQTGEQEDSIGQLTLALTEAQAELASEQQQLSQRSAELEVLLKEFDALQTKATTQSLTLNEVQTALAQTRTLVAGLTENRDSLAQRLAEIEKRDQKITIENDLSKRRVTALEDALTATEQATKDALERETETRILVTELRAQLTQAQNKSAQLESTLEIRTAAVAQLERQLDRAQAVSAGQETLGAAYDDLLRKLNEAETDLTLARMDLTKAQAQINRLSNRVSPERRQRPQPSVKIEPARPAEFIEPLAQAENAKAMPTRPEPKGVETVVVAPVPVPAPATTSVITPGVSPTLLSILGKLQAAGFAADR